MNTEMARQGVTFDEVSAAAISLQNDGKAVTIETVRDLLGAGSPNAVHKHLAAWRASHAQPAETPKADVPESILAELRNWAQQFAQEAGAGLRAAQAQSASDMEALRQAGEALEGELANVAAARDQALASVAELKEEIERLTVELRNAKQVAMDALVGKAKDQLAIEGKDSQLADLRVQVERYVASAAADSDARLAAQMELIGATTARDSLAAENKDLRAQLDSVRGERSALRAEMEALRAKA